MVAISLPGLGLAGTLPQSPDVWQQLSSLARLNLAGNELTVGGCAELAWLGWAGRQGSTVRGLHPKLKGS